MYKRETIAPRGIPVPNPSFAPAIGYGPWVFVSGLMATDFRSGLVRAVAPSPANPLVGEHVVIRESEYILKTLRSLLRAAGRDLRQIGSSWVGKECARTCRSRW